MAQTWQAVRPSVTVKLLAEEGELYILVPGRERGMRRRRLKTLWQRLGELQQQANTGSVASSGAAASMGVGRHRRAGHPGDLHRPPAA